MNNSEKERVREATDIIQLVSETVQLRQRGAEFWGCCPFHDEKTASFHVSNETGLWHCFGCGEGGDVFAYVEKREGMSFIEALRYLADRAGIELHYSQTERKGPKRSDLLHALSAAEAFYSAQLLRSRSQDAENARKYLTDRNMSIDVATKWHLGFAPGHSLLSQYLTKAGYEKEVILAADLAVMRGNHLSDRFYERIMFPIHNEHGQTIGFGGRVINDTKPKYINSKDSQLWHKSKNLFGFDLAKTSIQDTKTIIICEGYTDTIALHEAGLTNAVAVLGTALTLDHIQFLSRFKPERIIMLLDGDAAGQRAQEKAVRFIDKTTAALLSVTLPNNSDPQEYLDTEGKEALLALLDKAAPLVDEVLSRKLFSIDLKNPGQKVSALQEVSSVLAPLSGSVVLDGYAIQIADYLGMAKNAVIKKIASAKNNMNNVNAESFYETSKAENTKQSPEEEMERGIAYILLNHPTLAQNYLSQLEDLSYVREQYKAIIWTLLAQNTVKSSKDAMQIARASVSEVDELMTKPPQGYTDTTSEELLKRLLCNHMLLDARVALRKLKAEMLTHVSLEDSKRIMQNIVNQQKRIYTLQDKLDKMQVIK